MASIYIHIPFCKRACYYCNFHFSTSLQYQNQMIQAICKELYLRKGFFKNQKIQTIYFGGGTPSLLTFKQLELIFDILQTYFFLDDNMEITLEANPDDLSMEKIQSLSQTKINRLSIGIQSFFEEDLQKMNRAHNALQSCQSLENSRKYFSNITIDLIYGLPGMSLKRWKNNLQKAFDFGIVHLSSYALTVEKKTALAAFIKKKKYPALDDELTFKHFEILKKHTAKNGFVHYEISNFAKPNFFSKHNTSYWQGISYLGVGPSAHSFNGNSRFWNIANNQKYIKMLAENRLPLTEEKLCLNDIYNEYIMTGLRTIYGINLCKIKYSFGESYYKYLTERAKPFLENETLQIKNETLRATDKGKFLIDGIAADMFLVD